MADGLYYRGFCFEFNQNYFVFDINSYEICKINKIQYDNFMILQNKGNGTIDKSVLNSFYVLQENNLFFGKDIYLDYHMDYNTAYLSIAPIYDCNLRCKYCSAQSGLNYTRYTNEKNKFDNNTLQKTIDFFLEKLFPGMESYRIDIVSGGEALLQFDVVKNIIEYIEEKNKNGYRIKIWLATNGTILNNKINEFLSGHGVSIGISIDGEKKNHNYCRVMKNGVGSYDTVVKNLKKLQSDTKLSSRYKDIWGMTVVHAKNKDIKSSFDKLVSLNINNIQMEFVRLNKKNPFSLRREDYYDLIEQYRKFTDEILYRIQNRQNYEILSILNDNDYFGKIIKRIILNEIVVRRCNAGSNKVTICPNGDVFPCDYVVGDEKYKCGNIYKTQISLPDCGFSPYVFQRNKCKKCEVRYLCGGDCYFDSIICKGNVVDVNDDFCYCFKELCKMSIYLVFKLQNEYKDFYEGLYNRLYIKSMIAKKEKI